MASRPPLTTYESLAAMFAVRFPSRLDGPRTIGREAEFPVVDQEGRAVDIGQLWLILQQQWRVESGELLADSCSPLSTNHSPLFTEKRDAVNTELIVGLDGPAYSYALEVGKGTIELNVGPCDTLFELETLFRAGLRRLVWAAAQLGWRVLGYGVQPLSPPGSDLLSPKQRYSAMAEAMGAEWLWYTVTASDQAPVAITRDEAVPVLNSGNLLAPVVVALCGNSPVVAGELTGDCSSQEGCMCREVRYERLARLRRGPEGALRTSNRSADLHAAHGNRHGMPSRPYSDLTDFIERLSRLPYLLRREGDHLLPDGRHFADVLRSCGERRAGSGERLTTIFDAFLLHDHYVWHSARLRAAYGTIELRPACQQPPHEAMAATALYLGLIEGHRQIAEFVKCAFARERRIVQDSLALKSDPALSRCWARMKSYHHQVIRAGLAAPEPAPGFLAEVLRLAAAALSRRGYGEEQMLAPLWQRLAEKENPAQRARWIFVKKGLEGLIESVATDH